MKITQPKQPVTLALNAAASGVTVADPGGFYGGGPLTLEAVLALIGAGLSPNTFLLRRYGGGEDTYDLGVPMAASVVADLANASVFSGEMDQDTTIAVTGWLPAGRRSTIAFAIAEDGTGGWTPTFTGFTWIGGTPVWDTTAGTVTHVVAWSDDEGTTIAGAVVGEGLSAADVAALIAAALATLSALGFVGAILISDTPSTPLVFADLIQNEAQDDLVYADV